MKKIKLKTITNIVLIIGIIIPIFLHKGITFIPLLFIPTIARKIFKIKLEEIDIVLYYIFIFLSVYLGGCLKLYRITSYFDTLMHTLSGILFAYIGSKFVKNQKNIWFKFLFIISFSMASSAIWEILEFSIDRIVINSNLQRLETGVFDTMKDMSVHLLGTSVFIIMYCLDATINKSKIFGK